MDKIIIPNPKSSRKGQTYTLPTMNEYTLANRTNYHIGAQMKKKAQDHITYHLVLVPPITERATMHFIWYEERMNRDPDNICSARKFILDAMQEAGVLENDGWKQIKGKLVLKEDRLIIKSNRKQ